MRRNNTPYFIKRISQAINHFYVRQFLVPQFDSIGEGLEVAHPRSLVIFGRNIHLGKFSQLIAAPDNFIRFTTWPSKKANPHQPGGEIVIGDYCLISPGVRISAEQSIRIGDNCMFAANVYISDSDWHGIYNRIRPFRCSKPVVLENNVWLGEQVIVVKGVTIGENSVIGAGSVVTKNIPANSIAAGNPARVIKSINPSRRMLKRELLFKNPEHYFYNQGQMDRYVLGKNSLWNWLRSLITPNNSD
jgi:acetyltransferase-like isoleucine patch superfamily enzyme